MATWHKTGCILCPQNCGLELLVEDGRITKARPDKDNPRSQGYACRKGMNIAFHQYPKDRLTTPLKKIDNRFEPIPWERAVAEIAGKLAHIVDTHGPRALAFMGGGSTGGHMSAGFGLGLLRGLGSQYYYSSAGQEFSGAWWVKGRMFGRQYNIDTLDDHNARMLVGWGWNGMESHQMPRAPIVLKEFSRNPEKKLVIVDPRKSETANIADIHLAVRPGTNALLARAMIALILEKGWENKAYLDSFVHDFESIRHWFTGVNIKSGLDICQVPLSTVTEVCRLMTTRTWGLHPDLGIYMGRHSTLNSYLLQILGTVCGIFCVTGGNIIPGMLMPMGFHADERNPKIWRTLATQMPPAAAGSFPPAVFPDEVLSNHPQRLRAALVCGTNPLRAYPDTKAYEQAFQALDLSVVCDIAMTETARQAQYVLPCKTFYESWDTTFFPWTFPEIYFQLRRPVVEPPEGCREASQIFTDIADCMGLVPEIPDSLVQSARKKTRMEFGLDLLTFAGENKQAFSRMPFVLAKTLGKAFDSASKAALWGLLLTAPAGFRDSAARAGFAPEMDQGDRIFEALLNTPQGLAIGMADTENLMAPIRTDSGKIEIFIPEMEEGVKALTPESEARDLVLPEEFPMILSAGRHMKTNANTMMRNPQWHKGKKACTVAMAPEDAASLSMEGGQIVAVVTENGRVQGPLEVSDRVRPGTVIIPHGFGLNHDGEVFGFNANDLTLNTHRDPLGTPLHRFVPCRVEPVLRGTADER